MKQAAQLLLRAALLAVSVVPAADACGQEPLIVTPKAVAAEFLNAVTAGDWATVVRLTDDQSLWEYVTKLRASFREMREPPQYKPTIEMFMKEDSLMPRVVAEYMLRQSERYSQNQPPVLSMMFADVVRPSQLDSLADDEIFVRRLRARQWGYQFALANRLAGCPDQPAAVSEPARQVRGVALLSATEAVALYEESGGLFGEHRVHREYLQLELHRTKAGWRIVAAEQLFSGGSFAVGVSGPGCAGASRDR